MPTWLRNLLPQLGWPKELYCQTQKRPDLVGSSLSLLTSKRVLETANGILNLAGHLI